MATILLIDDDAAVLGTMRRVLERAGHTVLSAENGLVGLRLLQETPPDLVVTDLLMPEMEGIETIQEVSAAHPEVGIIAISGAGGGDGDPLVDAALFGAEQTLSKPFSMEELLEAVNAVLEHR